MCEACSVLAAIINNTAPLRNNKWCWVPPNFHWGSTNHEMKKLKATFKTDLIRFVFCFKCKYSFEKTKVVDAETAMTTTITKSHHNFVSSCFFYLLIFEILFFHKILMKINIEKQNKEPKKKHWYTNFERSYCFLDKKMFNCKRT